MKRIIGHDMYSLLKAINLKELIRSLVPEYPGTLSTRGAHRSPFREDRHPSFTMRTVNGVDYWKDWATGQHGTAIDAVMTVNNCAHDEAVKYLIEWIKEYDTSFFIDAEDQLIREVEGNLVKQRILRALLQASKTQILHNTVDPTKRIKDMQDWILERGVPSLESIKNVAVGAWSYEHLITYIPEEQIKQVIHTASRGPDERILQETAGLMFFYYNTFGNISAIKFRPTRASSRDGYFISKRDEHEDTGFFGLDLFSAGSANECLIVEGEFDYLVTQSRFISKYGEPISLLCKTGSAVASSNSFTHLKQLGFDFATIWPDNDEGGDRLVQESAKNAKSSGIILKVFTPKEYTLRGPGVDQDPASIMPMITDLDEFRGQMQKAVILPKWVAQRSIESYRRSTRQSDQDLSLLRKNLIETASDLSFENFDLDDYCKFINSQIPEVEVGVLKASIEHAEKAFLRLKVGESTYGMDNYGYSMLKYDKMSKEEYFTKMTNWVVRFDRIIVDDHGDNVRIRGNLIIDGKKVARFSENIETFQSGADIIKMVRKYAPTGVMVDKYAGEILPTLVSMANLGTPHTRGISRIGYLDKEPTYITCNMVVKDGEIIPSADEFELNFSGSLVADRYGFTYTTDLKDVRDGVKLITDKLIQLHEPQYTYYMLGHVLSSVITPFVPGTPPPPTTFFHRAKRSTGKTRCAKVFMNLFADWPENFTGPGADSTKNALEKELSHFGNCGIFIDDVKSNRKNAQEIMTLVQNAYDQQGRQRLNQDMSTRKAFSLRCYGMVITGEDIPTNQASTISRMISVVTSKKYNADIENSLMNSENRALLGCVVPHFIAWLQKKGGLKYSTMPKLPEISERPWYQLRYILTALEAFYEFAVSVGAITAAQAKENILKAHELSPAILSENTQAQTEAAQDLEFIDVLTQAIAAGDATLDNSTKGTQVGFVRGDSVYLLPDQCVKIVSSRTNRKYNKIDLAQDLFQSGFLVPSADGLTWRPRLGGMQVRAWKVLKTKLELDPKYFGGMTDIDESPKEEKKEPTKEEKKESPTKDTAELNNVSANVPK